MAQAIQVVYPSSPDAPVVTSTILNDVNLEYSSTSGVLSSLGQNAINNMIENILTTLVGSRHYEPTFGSNIPALIWEPFDAVTTYKIETNSFDALKQWMPYIRVNYKKSSISAFVQSDGSAGFSVTIAYVDVVSGLTGAYNANLLRIS